MKFDDPVEFRRALEARLVDLAGDDERWLERDRRCIAFGRLLARFDAVAPGAWSISGGFAVDCHSLRPRTAEVLDLDWKITHHEEFLEIPDAVIEHDLGDLFEFEAEGAGARVDSAEASKRFQVRALLAKELFETFLLNVRLRYAKIGTQRVQTDDLLGFAGIEPLEIESLAVEALIAECLYEHVQAVEWERGPPQACHLLDLKLLSELPGIRATRIALCVLGIFSMREEEMPYCVYEPPEYWAEWYEEAAEEMGAPADIEEGHGDVAALLEPILSGEVLNATWLPAEQHWRPNDGSPPPQERP